MTACFKVTRFAVLSLQLLEVPCIKHICSGFVWDGECVTLQHKNDDCSKTETISLLYCAAYQTQLKSVTRALTKRANDLRGSLLSQTLIPGKCPARNKWQALKHSCKSARADLLQAGKTTHNNISKNNRAN